MSASRLVASVLLMIVLSPIPAHAKETPPRSVAVFVHEDVELLDFAGPAEVFANANVNGRRAFKVYTVAPTKAAVRSQQNVTVVPQYSIDDCPPPAILVIPGGATNRVTEDARVMEWIKRTHEKTEVTLTVCTGAFALGEQGLLDGMKATTHWSAIAGLRREHPKVDVKENVRFVDNGHVVTTAGISAGIDGALHVVARLCGVESAWTTARYMEYDWSPPKLSASESTPAQALEREALEQWVFQRWDQAADAYERLIKLEPTSAEAHAKLAACQLRLERNDAALASATRARELGWSDPSLLTLIARSQLGAKRYDAAIKSYTEAIAAGQDGPTNQYNLACAYARTGRTDDAIASLQEALKLGPWMKRQAARDEDLASIREDERFRALVAGGG